jgi:SHS2 domain-containing protein
MEHMQATPSGHSWEHFPHAADMGIRGFGDTRAEAFAHAALALTAIICKPDSVKPEQPVTMRCEAPDDELLLADWLNALIYEMAVRRMLFSRFEIAMENGVLTATAWGEAVDRLRHQPAVEVKGATYTELKVYRDERGLWVAQCVVDV